MATMFPRRGEIWYTALPTDPAKRRPVLVVSADSRNLHEKADTLLVVPFTTNLRESPTRIQLDPGETGLAERSSLAAENITVVRKASLAAERGRLRALSEARLREVAGCVLRALGFVP